MLHTIGYLVAMAVGIFQTPSRSRAKHTAGLVGVTATLAALVFVIVR